MKTLRAMSLTIIMLTAGHAGLTQQKTPSTLPPATQSTGVPFGTQNPIDPNPLSAAAQEQLEKGRQSDRQKKLIADTNRLFALATELKAEMDKTTRDEMSIQVIKKAEEIEKLARSVKERMKG